MRGAPGAIGDAVRFSGVGGREMAAKGLRARFDRRSRDHRFHRDPAPAARASCGAFAMPPDSWWRARPRCAGDHRQPRLQPPGGAPRARRRAPRSRSSTMFHPQSGRGGRAARAQCAAMSIMCWPCCRSNRRRMSGSAARLAPMSAIRCSNSLRTAARCRRGGTPACRSTALVVLPGSRPEKSAGSCRASAPPSRPWQRVAVRSNCAAGAAASRGADRGRDRRLAGAAAHRGRDRGTGSEAFRTRARRSRNPAP